MRPRKRRPTFSEQSGANSSYTMATPASSMEDPLPMPIQHRRNSRYTPSSFVERWIHRSSPTEDERPMLANHHSFNGADDEYDDDFGVGIPIDNYPLLNSPSASDSLSLKSKPSTRRSSVDSSIDDVCRPLDDEEKVHYYSGYWPDISVLNEFAAKEMEDQASAEAADLVRESVNEAADAVKGGRLRPRYAPWERSNVLKSQSTMRFTYFRDDLEATVHSPSIAGLVQPGQSFADLFPPTTDASPTESSIMPTGSVVPPSKFGEVRAGELRPSDLKNGETKLGENDKIPPPHAVAVSTHHSRSSSSLHPHAEKHPSMSSSSTHLEAPRAMAPGEAEKAANSPIVPVVPTVPTSQIGGVPAHSGAHSHHETPHGSHSPSRLASPAPPDPGPKEAFPAIQPSHDAHLSSSKPRLGSVAPSYAPTETAQSVIVPTSGPWWLDINCPTEDEMRVLSRAFGIHPLTTEDIILHETREKVELFHNYYFVCFTSFDVKAWESTANDEDNNNPKFGDERKRRGSVGQRSSNSSKRQQRQQRRGRVERLKPLAIFSIVFKTGIITVHYRPTPHTINVRRRIRLLKDYLNVSSDWISYALIDDITDGYGPLISAVDEDVQGIEDAILKMHGSSSDSESDDESDSDDGSHSSGSSSTGYREWREKGNMLRWIGECRKRVMSLLSLLSNKADVIKGFSKRVSDQWSGAPRSEIAMYLSDIQDHLVTMTQSLNHYEKLLARSHSNYLAQINIDMTRTNNEMNDVLGKISVLGTIVLPMNIVTGLWGMNVLVPGQGVDDSLAWFWSITVMMVVFAVSAYFLIMRFV